MNFESLCEVFPKDEKLWPCQKPSRALPIFLKSYLRQKFGGFFSANDLFKKHSPSRIGITSRNFEDGDPISTISKQHFMKTDEVITRIDYSYGRQKAIGIFHVYQNMTYQSESSSINKGQLGNGVMGVLEEIHTSLSQSFHIIKANKPDLLESCKPIEWYLKNADYIYFLTDFLFDSSDVISSVEKALEIIKLFKIKKSIFLIIRDPEEFPDKKNIIEELYPWKEEKNLKHTFCFSGENYVNNIYYQINYFKEKTKNSNHTIKVIYPKESINILIDYILKNVLGKIK
ncbi:hypothetical protein [Spirobacillus cienkowskii]|uniref:hypothetical protein n=1 Tax=Spirobacillus cienkowskii TaxID=495820 RepID=UPI0030D0295D